MRNRLLALVVAAFWGGLVITACGGGGGGSEPTTGSSVNDSWDVADLVCTGTVTGGTFSDAGGNATVTIAAGEMSVCANATADPTLSAAAALPDGVSVSDANVEVNATSGGKAYEVTVGERGFDTTTAGAVTISLAIDTADIPLADQTSESRIFIRIFNPEDNSVVDLNGTIAGGVITVETRGLPARFTALVVYSAGMDAVSAGPAPSPSISKAMTPVPPWPGRSWCALYNANSQTILAQARTYTGVANPTPLQIKTMITNQVANNALAAHQIYEGAGFRAPDLYISSKATEPCGAGYYYAHVVDAGNKYVSDDPGEVIAPDGNHFGRLYVSIGALNWTRAANSATVKNVVAHEMLHAIQSGYELKGVTTKGYREGTATTYGETIDTGNAAIAVRSLSIGETELLSDYVSADSGTYGAVAAYANQDFLAYVGKQYNSGTLKYLPALFEKMRDDIAAQAAQQTDAYASASFRAQPSRPILFGAMDSSFQTAFGASNTLKAVYLDFLRQRAFDHNGNSQFGRAGETTSGFAQTLFATSATDDAANTVRSVMIDPDDCSITDGSGGFGRVAPFAARAIVISPSKAATSTTLPTVTVRLSPASGSMGDTWDGFVNRSAATQAVAASNDITSFGAAATDRISVAVANVTQNQRTSITYEVACSGAGGGGGGGGGDASAFAIDTWSAAGQAQMAPRSVTLMPDWTESGVLQPMISSVTFSEPMTSAPYITMQFYYNAIPGPGTYAFGDPAGSTPAYFLYANLATPVGYVATGGTITFTQFGTNAGDHIAGTFMANLVDDYDPAKPAVGSIGGSFDFVVGSMNNL